MSSKDKNASQNELKREKSMCLNGLFIFGGFESEWMCVCARFVSFP